MSDRRNNSGGENLLSGELVAYLDGELTEQASRQIEKRLSENGAFRERLHQHQQAWDMLDQLPKTQVGDRFAHTTLEMVAVSAGDGAKGARLQLPSGRRLAWIGGSLGGVISAVAGYLAVATLVSVPNRQLVEDLPVIENLDAYRHAESVEFLRALAENDLFAVEDDEDAL